MAKRNTLLVVAKDAGSFNVTYPVMQGLSGVEFVVCAEGVAKTKFEGVGIIPIAPEDAEETLRQVNPVAVLTGLGWPINLEHTFALAANTLSIPLVFAEDFWACHNRTTAVPQIAGVVDDFGKKIILKRHPETKVVITGNPGVS